MGPSISGVNVFASVYLQKADTLYRAGDVAYLVHHYLYWFCSVCILYSFVINQLYIIATVSKSHRWLLLQHTVFHFDCVQQSH